MTPVEAVVEYKPGQGIWTTTWSDPDRKIRPELAEKVDELFARGLTDVQIALDLGIQPETLRIVRRSLQLYRDPKASSGRRGWPAGKPRAFDAPAVGRHTVLLRQEDMDRIERLRAREGGAMSLSKLVHRALAALEGKARKKATP